MVKRTAGKFSGSIITLLIFFGFASLSAQTFTGTNSPGATAVFGFTTTGAATNLSLSLPGSAAGYSHLLLRNGAPPTDTAFNFISQLTGQTNSIHLELPELLSASYYAGVRTPAGAVAHNFTLLVDSNRSDMRSVTRPVTKPLESTNTGLLPTNGAKHYFRFEVPTNTSAWKISLTSTSNSPDLFIRRDQVPSETVYLKRSLNSTNDTISFVDAELSPGAYFVGAFSPAGSPTNVNYTLRTETLNVNNLVWDLGATLEGTSVYTNQASGAGDFYFKIRTENPALGAWRTALKVTGGEADIYLSRGTLPSATVFDFKSDKAGSDGFVLSSSQFNAGEDWYIMVRAAAGSQWTLVTGAPFVTDLGNVAADASSGTGDVVIGPEGIRFFQTTMPANTLAWRLWLNGASNSIYLKKTGVPLPLANELTQVGQMLVVPSYLTVGQIFFIGVTGLPGTVVNLDSRQQSVADISFASTTSIAVSGYGYSTYRVTVPPQQIAWQINLSVASGAANVAVRRNLVANESNNDAYSEIPGLVTDNITLVPPVLSDGTFYITVYNTNLTVTNCSFTLENGPPVVTDINYVTTIANDDTNRVGWRFYRVTDINQQLGSLGWDLFLTNFSAGTKIALRRNSAPGLWTARLNSTPSTATYYDFLSTAEFLQRPGHQADIWYIGVYNPTNVLGNFTLITRELTPEVLSGDGGTSTRSNVTSGKWEFFRVDVPSDISGWDIRLTGVTSGLPKIVVRRELLPTGLTTTLATPATATNWISGAQWASTFDWTKRTSSADGSVVEDGRILAMGMGRPLQAGIYYVGVINATGTNALSYKINSRFIGDGRAFSVTNLEYANGAVTNLALAPREAAYYSVVIPPNTPSWKVRLNALSGEVMLVVSTNRIPNLESEKRMQKFGREHYVLLPRTGQDYVTEGTNYLVVIGEGVNPVSSTRIGAGDSSYILESLGVMPEVALGTLDGEIVRADSLEGGESRAYHFSTLPGSLGFEIYVEDAIGNPTAVSRGDWELADPGLGVPADPYGNEGGETGGAIASSYKIEVADPFPQETIMVKARISGGLHPDASYTLRVKEKVPQPLTFDSGISGVTNQPGGTWKYFRVVVPANALGWDIRITNVLSGDPEMAVGRDVLPISLTTTAGFTPATSTNWTSGNWWAAAKDWTERSFSADGAMNEDGRVLAMGMNRPLRPGVYYIGVRGATTEDMNYTLVSRGIGDGLSIPVQELNFSGGTTNASVPAREAAFFKVVIPTNTPSWKLDLSPATDSEAALVVAKDAVPNILAGSTFSGTNSSSPGRKMQKLGAEHYLLLPAPGQTNLFAGTYYIAAISEGQNPLSSTAIGTSNSTFTLTSVGALPFVNLGTVSPIVDLVRSGAVAGGETVAYQFTVPPGTLSIEARLENRVGNPVMVMRPASKLPDPGMTIPGSSADTYGNEGGEVTGTDINATFINAANPTPGTYFVLVKGRSVGAVHTNAGFTLRLNSIGAAAVNFNDDFVSITNHAVGTWKYFVIDVPTNALGWDIRLTNVAAGLPRMVVRRDALPNSLTLPAWSLPGSAPTWPSSNQWAAASDWTRRANSVDGLVIEDGRILAMGMGRPLQPGTYYVGVINATGSTNAMSYQLLSRGIGSGFAIPVVDLPFNGSVTNLILPAREAAYYRVVVPSNTPSWKVKLNVTGGEAMLAGLFSRLPNVDSVLVGNTLATGKGVQKAGNEQFLQLPVAGQTNVPAGTNYFVVVGEGINPASATRVGTGNGSFVLKSMGALPITDLGIVASSDIEQIDELEGGEAKAYQFTVPSGALGVEVRLEDRIGNPVLVMRPDASLPNPGGSFGTVAAEQYGNEGGFTPVDANSTLLTIPNPIAGTYTLMVKARALGTIYSDASYRLRIREVLSPVLNFSTSENTNGLANLASGVLENNQRAFFKVTVPSNHLGSLVLGWKLDVSQSSGLASLRVRKDFLPSDAFAGMPFTTPTAIIAPPFLTNGTWYVEVKGSNSTAFTLTSRPLELERPAWLMPVPDQITNSPGVTLPTFGDTGIDTNGIPTGGDQSLFLEQGNFHYYGILISTQNVGVLRARLEAVSGNPDIYLRFGSVPTLQHNVTGAGGTIFDRSMLALTTEHANWVPLDGKTETKLKPGFWFLAVRAAGNANARYRLQVSVGNIQDIPIQGANLTSQVLAGGDWRYYRIQMPNEAPSTWQVNFGQQSGDVVMYLRDTLPPGNGNTATEYKDWTSDGKNSGPYGSYDLPGTYSFTVPPIRPGSAYYLGFRAVNDATFSLATSTTGPVLAELPTIDFYGGNVTLNVDPASQLTYRIDVPADATRWKHTSLHTTNLLLFIEQGTLPTKVGSDDWKSASANSSLNQYLLTTWPWLPNQSYYLTVTNPSASSQSFSFTMDGRNAVTDDNDNDLLPDAWELQYFGALNQAANTDADGDGISNLLEFQEGTSPVDKNSYRPRLTTGATNGVIVRSPNDASYPVGSTVWLTPMPNPGYAFVSWGGQASGFDNPMALTMSTNKNVNGLFKVIGDEFSRRLPINGTFSSVTGTNIGATKEAGEPNHAGNSGGKSLWWTWTAPVSGTTTLSTAGSSFNTLLAVYTGTDVSGLTLVASDNNSLGGANRSRVVFNCVAGVTYQIAVDGFNSASGSASLTLTTTSGLSQLSAPTVGGNSLQFTLHGEPNSVYTIEFSTNLVNWASMGSVTNITGTLSVTNLISSNLPQGYYRVRNP